MIQSPHSTELAPSRATHASRATWRSIIWGTIPGPKFTHLCGESPEEIAEHQRAVERFLADPPDTITHVVDKYSVAVDLDAFAAHADRLAAGDVACAPDSLRDEAAAAPKRTRKPSIATLIKRAEKAGKTVTSITTPDGTTIHFGETKPTDDTNPWLAEIEKATKQ